MDVGDLDSGRDSLVRRNAADVVFAAVVVTAGVIAAAILLAVQ